MTPERQKWWDSLPTEEKQVRRSIEWQQETIRHIKALWNNDELASEETIEGGIREAKKAIKALRKQIAMRPAIKKEFVMFRFCPTCDCILNVSKARPFCDKCGQKLRWQL